ncbi:MAG: Fic family protein [Deltaproteobacteria bacterium]|nr:Fic family protein [Deltaproteobacteria bacterium]
MSVRYIYQRQGWPKFTWNIEGIITKVSTIRLQQGRLVGRMLALGFPYADEASLDMVSDNIVKSSAIEGEHLDLSQVRSSVARQLGVEVAGLKESGRYVDGVVAMTLDATQMYDKPLTQDRLFGWHAALFPAPYSSTRRIKVAAWREDKNGPMQVISGVVGKEQVHFEAPPAKCVDSEMQRFLAWFNASGNLEPVIKAGMAHLWFVTIHPFDDGNGRIARAITDMCLAQSEQCSRRFYSLSNQFLNFRNDYYNELEHAQKGTLDISRWLEWFLEMLATAITGAEAKLSHVLLKGEFWHRFRNVPLNARQILVVNRLLDGFDGNLTTLKYSKLVKCSTDTALRDVTELIAFGLVRKKPAGGRSTAYELIMDKRT